MLPRKRYALNVVGPFYVEDGCCSSCGVPPSIAPALFAENEHEHEHCYVQRQPANEAETDAMIRVIATQELGCIRYGGSDPTILRRLVEAGEGDQVDQPAPRGVVPIRRDHVRFAAKPRPTSWTARELLERMVAFNARWRTTSLHERSGTSASVSVAWFEDDYHRIDAFISNESRVWIVRHRGPPRLSDSIHDWLVEDPAFDSVRWQTREQSESDGAWTTTPW